MFHHPQRWNQWNFYNIYRKLGYISFQKYNFLYNSYIYQYFKNIRLDKYFNDDADFSKRMELFYLIMTDIKKLTDKLFPGSRFIFLIYSDVNYDLSKGILNSVNYDQNQINKLFEIMYSSEFRKRLENIGFEVITTEELIGRKMDKPEDRIPKNIDACCHPHPSEKAWDLILPELEKKLPD